MANKKLAIKLNPVSVNVPRVADPDAPDAPKPLPTFKSVKGALVSIENGANGDTLATDAPQDAVIEFFETGDKQNPAAILVGSLKLENGVPKFDLSTATFRSVLKEADSDFSIDLEYSTANFTGKGPSSTLFLPYVARNLNLANRTAGNFAVSAHLRLGGKNDIGTGTVQTPGTVESPAFKSQADIPMLQPVAFDADEAFRLTLIGPASSGHPLELHFTTAVQPAATFRIPKAGTTFEILLHDSVRRHCESLKTGSFDFARFQANVNTMLGGAFAGIAFREIPTDAAFSLQWAQNSTSRLVSTTVSDREAANPATDNPNASPGTFTIGQGHVTPFFQYLVHAAVRAQPGTGEMAVSERLDSIQAAAKTKRILTPIEIIAGRKTPFADTYSAQPDAATCMRLLAVVIVHEIGHALGLAHAHAINLDGNHPKHALKSTVTLMSGGIASGDRLKKLGPVHTAVLQRTYP